MVLASPFESLATLALVVGIWLVVLGVMEVIVAIGMRKAGNVVAEAIEPATP